jgi:hypothetical protein
MDQSININRLSNQRLDEMTTGQSTRSSEEWNALLERLKRERDKTNDVWNKVQEYYSHENKKRKRD